jgi:hypothetical protein
MSESRKFYLGQNIPELNGKRVLGGRLETAVGDTTWGEWEFDAEHFWKVFSRRDPRDGNIECLFVKFPNGMWRHVEYYDRELTDEEANEIRNADTSALKPKFSIYGYLLGVEWK